MTGTTILKEIYTVKLVYLNVKLAVMETFVIPASKIRFSPLFVSDKILPSLPLLDLTGNKLLKNVLCNAKPVLTIKTIVKFAQSVLKEL
jgi:hypothetical protein